MASSCQWQLFKHKRTRKGTWFSHVHSAGVELHSRSFVSWHRFHFLKTSNSNKLSIQWVKIVGNNKIHIERSIFQKSFFLLNHSWHEWHPNIKSTLKKSTSRNFYVPKYQSHNESLSLTTLWSCKYF